MKVIRALKDYRGKGGAIVTIGNFDGVHRGHRRILEKVVRRARALGVRSVVVTFDPHTKQVLGAGAGFRCLSTPAEKQRLLKGLGVDVAVFLRFGKALRRKGAVAFLEQIVLRHLRPVEIVFGYDHRFGRQRAGDYALIRKWCQKHGVRVSRVAPRRLHGQTVSSTRIRERVAKGDMTGAAGLLGGPYSVCGKIVKGEGVGRKLGFPTANLAVAKGKLLMPDGVYAGKTIIGAKHFPALVSLGTRPTFHGRKRVFEAHLPGFKGSLYGKEVCLEIERFLRPQRKMDGPKALMAQIEKDKRRILKN